ncbi:hypothetical protein SPRG_14193 [Saprolegnia parasitica CBS 223.65]|uniref:Uncharacterized protein n=1 Tax=Saprolegnia parasitica (strain CBS 223.65) TaxID=695850 RepID=A0A067BT85_SAPPC|nr:hypothetical protein SPRG_14193 [Saprolegnia parasitica CBS 223.65]KDO20045.1 hypothetical protein SPRG_14193 [Saprolegnia parasitica CBS 223.65]|eukprot:XP_012209279.1 hypothetical protein SPRG_14193 [Saprolegnia parasitica CBS 223.65]
MALLVSAHQRDDALHPAPTCTEPECHHCTKKPKLDASPGKGASTTSKPSSTNTTPMPPRPSSPVLTDSTVSLGSFWTDDIPQATIESVENEIRSWRNAILRGETPDLRPNLS